MPNCSETKSIPPAPTSQLGPTYKTWKKAGWYRDYRNLRLGFQSLTQYIDDSGARPINDQAFALVEHGRANLHAQTEKSAPDGLIFNERAPDRLTIAVQVRVRKDRRLLTFGVEKLVVQINQVKCRVEPAR